MFRIDNNTKSISRGHNYPIWCVAESPAGLYLATGSRDSTARLWSTDREHPLETFIGHTQDIDVRQRMTFLFFFFLLNAKNNLSYNFRQLHFIQMVIILPLVQLI